jgi:hypothetical protein
VLEKLVDTALVKTSTSFSELEGSHHINTSCQLVRIYLFIYGLFNDAVGGSEFVTSNERTIREQ